VADVHDPKKTRETVRIVFIVAAFVVLLYLIARGRLIALIPLVILMLIAAQLVRRRRNVN
jgi:hypothetical protein